VDGARVIRATEGRRGRLIEMHEQKFKAGERAIGRNVCTCRDFAAHEIGDNAHAWSPRRGLEDGLIRGIELIAGECVDR
jgi:hypothetical protein